MLLLVHRVGGEDVAKAYHDKVKDLMKTLTTNILTQKVTESMLGNTEKLIKKKWQARAVSLMKMTS